VGAARTDCAKLAPVMNRPELITSIAGMMETARRAKTRGTIALVPTMGALHEGHLSLARAAKKMCTTVIVSIFVNPAQFGPNEDYDRYPRSLEADLELLTQEDVDFVFAPTKEEMYPQGAARTYVEVEGISNRLDGQSRLGHFRGVATVVAKLFNITTPDAAFFGQKDAAQVAVLRAMVHDLNFGVRLVVCPTVREADGLAMSSRNRYLTADERARSLVVYRALSTAQSKATGGVRHPSELRKTMLNVLQKTPEAQIEYADVVDPDTLEPIVADRSENALLAIAVRIGKTRLIDNALLPGENACE
jgi:pantoate--beta-alanine ligase